MTAPHTTAANAVKYLESGGTGLTGALPATGCCVKRYGESARGKKEATTREAT